MFWWVKLYGVKHVNPNSREWALKWVEGSVVGYIKGSTPLNILLGRIRKALKMGVTLNDINLLLKSIEVDPKYSTPMEVRREKIEELRKALESLKEE